IGRCELCSPGRSAAMSTLHAPACPPPVGSERRELSRYPADEVRVELAWWDEGCHCRTVVVVIDLCLEGLGLLADAAPPSGAPAWVRVATGPDASWVPVVLLHAAPLRSGH